MDSAIVLTGFMGVGKTTVGRIVAEKLGCPFVDLDTLIESLSGRAIPDLFAEGEATFRWWEQLALGRLDLEQPLVVATGGGALVGAWNQGRVAGVLVVVLEAPYDEIAARVQADGGRPLAAHLPTLFARRAAAYARLPHHLPTDGRTPEEIAEAIIALAARAPRPTPTTGGGETLTVRTPDGGRYAINVQVGVAAGIGGYVAALRPGAVALITDSEIGPLWGETVRHDLLAARLPTTLIEIPAGEAHKTLETTALVYDRLLDAGIDRSGVIVALGGGVVGDLAGFVAATWMRGVRGFVQVPTSLLAMVDASIGGKTGVDHPRGKNLIGAFRQPDLVLADPTFLHTLPPRQWRSGMAEVVKHAILADPALFHEIGTWDAAGPREQTLSPALLARAIRVKAETVERDPFERGERAKLNLGHTFGHAYELLSGFELTHGEAVSVGIVTAARLSEALGLTQRGLAAQIEATLQHVGLPTRWAGASDGERVWATMQSDKKKGASGLRLVLPRALGDVIITEPGAIGAEQVIPVIEQMANSELRIVNSEL